MVVICYADTWAMFSSLKFLPLVNMCRKQLLSVMKINAILLTHMHDPVDL